MLNNIKYYLITILATFLVTLTGMYLWNKDKIIKLTDQVARLEVQNEEITQQLNVNAIQLKKDTDTAEKLKTQLVKSDKDLESAKITIASLQHVQPVAPINNDQEAIAKITDLYHDATTTFQDGRFRIMAPTTYLILGDAENWKVNAPILEDNLKEYRAGWDSALISLKSRDDLIAQKDIVIDDYKQRDVIHEDLHKNDKEQVVKLNSMLKSSESNGTIKAIGGFLTGITLYYLKDKLGK